MGLKVFIHVKNEKKNIIESKGSLLFSYIINTMYSNSFPLLCRKTYHENKIDVGHFESKDESASEECCEINEGNFLHGFFLYFFCYLKMRLFIFSPLYYSYAILLLLSDENLLKREQINSWIFSPDFCSAQLWAEERTAFSRTTKKIGTMDAFSLPVGVKFPHQTNNDLQSSEAARFITLDDPRDGSLSNATFPSLDLLSGANLEAAMDIYSSTLKQFKSKSNESSKKQGSLSTRATSMLVNMHHYTTLALHPSNYYNQCWCA